jgi:predicted Rossmann fold nucleotide-binding protein DprA/Smf involved in DNA uptake
MKKLKDQLKTISGSLTSLSKQVEKITKQVERLQPKKAAVAPKKTAAKKKVAAKKAPAKKAPAKKASAKKAPAKPPTVIDSILNAIKKTKKGITIAQLKEKTEFNSKQLSNALYKLTKKGKIEATSRGLYVKK